jgi:ATP-dependent helicase/DNAse subunit B
MENKLKLTLENRHVFLLEKEFNISLEGIKIKGKIDRIDLIFLDKIYFIVYDYKSSNTFPSTNDIKNYKSFQLPIYLFAAQEILKNEFEIEAEIGGAFYVNLSNTTNKFSTYYNLRIGNPFIIDLLGSLYTKSNKFVSITNDNSEEEKTKLAEELKKIQDNIKNGEFEINQDAKKNYDFDQLIRDYSVF